MFLGIQQMSITDSSQINYRAIMTLNIGRSVLCLCTVPD